MFCNGILRRVLFRERVWRMQKDTLPHPWFVCRPAVAEKFGLLPDISSIELILLAGHLLKEPLTSPIPDFDQATSSSHMQGPGGCWLNLQRRLSTGLQSDGGWSPLLLCEWCLGTQCMHTVVDGGSNVWTCCWIRKPRGGLGI